MLILLGRHNIRGFPKPRVVKVANPFSIGGSVMTNSREYPGSPTARYPYRATLPPGRLLSPVTLTSEIAVCYSNVMKLPFMECF